MFPNYYCCKNTKPRKPPVTDPYQSILKLNDYCLYELLTYLPLQDLWSLATTCRRINDIAEHVYPRFSNLDVKHFLKGNPRYLTTERKMRSIIQQMGQHVKSFQISCIIEEVRKCETLIKLILIHCDNIIGLKIGFYIRQELLEQICSHRNFQKLKTVDIIGHIPLKVLWRLQHIRLTHVRARDLLLLKNLESLCFNFEMYMLHCDIFSKICDNNPDIKRIDIQRMSTSIINIIVDKLIHLESIIVRPLHTNRTSIRRISEIKSLKSLSTVITPPDLFAELIELDQLESLTYYYKPNQNEAQLITKFTKLKFLHATALNDAQLKSLKSQRTLEHLELDYSYGVTNEGIVDFVNGAIKLKYLILRQCYNCDEDVLEMLTDLVKSSNRKPRLTVQCDLFTGWCLKKEYPWLNMSFASYRPRKIDELDNQ